MKRVKMIINPSSGRQLVERKIDYLSKLLLDDGYIVGKYFTEEKNDAKNERAEYFLSQNSFAAIDAILDAHKEIVLKNKYYDFASFAMNKGASIELLSVIEKIEEMKNELKTLEKDDFTKANNLFVMAKDLHNAYYICLIGQLSIVGKILDADGD